MPRRRRIRLDASEAPRERARAEEGPVTAAGIGAHGPAPYAAEAAPSWRKAKHPPRGASAALPAHAAVRQELLDALDGERLPDLVGELRALEPQRGICSQHPFGRLTSL
jgi:hypothetical protein